MQQILDRLDKQEQRFDSLEKRLEQMEITMAQDKNSITDRAQQLDSKID